jgi:hypothetical protein
MSDSSLLPDFASFASALRQTRLPGTGDRRFLKDIYRLARRGIYLQTEGQQTVKATALKQKQVIQDWRSVIGTLKRAQRNLTKAQKFCEEKFPDPFYWKIQFQAATESLSDLVYSILQTQRRTLARLHPHSLKKEERLEVKWESLLWPNEYDYPLARLGWKPAATWLIGELDDLFSVYFEGEKVTATDRHRLVKAIVQIAFKVSMELNAIKVAISRIKERRAEP